MEARKGGRGDTAEEERMEGERECCVEWHGVGCGGAKRKKMK